MSPPNSAILLALLGLAGLASWAAASAWAKVGRDREAANERPAIPVHAFRYAANLTVVALGLLGGAAIWGALILLGV